MSAARGRSVSTSRRGRAPSVSPTTAAVTDRKVREAIRERGHKVINDKTGELEDFEPSDAEVALIAPKQRRADRREDGAVEELEEAIDKLIASKNNLYAAKKYLNRLLGSKKDSIPAANKDAILPKFITALIARSKINASNEKRDDTVRSILRGLLRKGAAPAVDTLPVNEAVSAVMAAKMAEKSVRGGIADEVATAMVAINPAYTGYKPNAKNIKRYEELKSENSLDRFDRYLLKEAVAAKIALALEKQAAAAAAKKPTAAMRNLSPNERVASRMNMDTAMRNVSAYIGEGNKISASNVRRLAEIRARGLADLTALQYFKMIREVFRPKEAIGTKGANETKKAKKLNNNGGAAGGAGAGAGAAGKSRGRSATRRANRAGASAGAEALMAAMLGE